MDLKILQTPTPTRSRRLKPTIDDDIERTAMHIPENIERWEEKESGSVQIKMKCRIATGFRLIKGIGDNFMAIAIVV